MAEMRTVAFLDILGFKNKIETTPLDKLSGEYEQVIAQARAFLGCSIPQGSHPSLFQSRAANVPWCTQYVFSDSIILISKGDTEANCLELLIYTWRLCQFFLCAGMPLRGGISYHEMYSNPESGLFLGKALTSAYKIEAEQDWIGVSIDDTITKRYQALLKRVEEPTDPLSLIFKRYPVPMKNRRSREMYTVNWRYNLIVESGTRSLFPESADRDAQQKIDNTLAYAKSVIDSGQVYSTGGDRDPIEIRHMYCGAKEPPFCHGDDL